MIVSVKCLFQHVLIRELVDYIYNPITNKVTPDMRILYISVSFNNFDNTNRLCIPKIWNWKFTTIYYPFSFFIEVI